MAHLYVASQHVLKKGETPSENLTRFAMNKRS
jgi:hypothetical protein